MCLNLFHWPLFITGWVTLQKCVVTWPILSMVAEKRGVDQLHRLKLPCSKVSPEVCFQTMCYTSWFQINCMYFADCFQAFSCYSCGTVVKLHIYIHFSDNRLNTQRRQALMPLQLSLLSIQFNSTHQRHIVKYVLQSLGTIQCTTARDGTLGGRKHFN